MLISNVLELEWNLSKDTLNSWVVLLFNYSNTVFVYYNDSGLM